MDALFALAVAIPLAALWLTQANMRRIQRLFSLTPTRRRELVGVIAALALLPVLLGVAAAQPVVVRHHSLGVRSDVQAFLVFDTSTSMSARQGPDGPTRLTRAKREAEAVVPKLGDIPVGLATMTDRVLPDLMPTPNFGLVINTLRQSVGIDRPPPTQRYRGRATTFQALFPIANSQFYSPGVRRQILVVFTDGEDAPFHSAADFDLAHAMTLHPLFVHVWGPTERIYKHGRIDPRYRPDPTSGPTLSRFAAASGGQVFGEDDTHGLVQAIRDEAGSSHARTTIVGYARVALAPWFVLAGVIPLGFLLYRRNF
jgi:hypothetical protein